MLNIAALSTYPKHRKAVIYLTLSFPNCCILPLLLVSRPSLITFNCGHLAFHYKHSRGTRWQAQHVYNNITVHKTWKHSI